MTLETLRVQNSSVHLLGVIKGLISESKKVEQTFKSVKPDKVAVSLSKENVRDLRKLPDDYEPELSNYEEIYAKGLRRFGEVAAPPPCFVAAIELADHYRVPVVPIDLDERAYTDLYCAVVGGGTLFRHTTRTWYLKRRKFSTKSPEDFVLAWDKAVNGMEAFRIIENKRAEHMANRIVSTCSGTVNLLAVIELERAKEVGEIVRQAGAKAT